MSRSQGAADAVIMSWLRTFIAIVILISGAIVFGCDPSKFVAFSICSLQGTTVLSAALLLVGASLWVRD